jgi:hypothetical protein
MIAVQIIVENAERWWVLKIGYDNHWSKYSPGMQLMFDTIEQAFYAKWRLLSYWEPKSNGSTSGHINPPVCHTGLDSI